MGVQTTISIGLLQAAPKLSDVPAAVWQTSYYSIHNWQNGCIDDWWNYQKYRFIIRRPVPWECLSIVFTHPLPSNVGVHRVDGKAKWLDKDIGRGIATHLYRRTPVIWGFFLVMFWIYTSSGRAKDPVNVKKPYSYSASCHHCLQWHVQSPGWHYASFGQAEDTMKIRLILRHEDCVPEAVQILYWSHCNHWSASDFSTYPWSFLEVAIIYNVGQGDAY